MKLYPFWHCAFLLFFFSCNKNCLIAPELSEQQIVSVSASGSANSDLDTDSTNVTAIVVPDNAVSFKKYGALGNGVSDDSEALQHALDAERVLVLPAGTYIINKTLNVKANTKIYGANGAIIKTGLLMKSTLLTLGRYFYLTNADNCLFNNIRFQQSLQPFKFSQWGSACIYLENSANVKITNNFFDFNLPYSNTGFVGVWVNGGGSRNTQIKANRLISAGIEYAESGAGGTIVDGNYIANAPADALVAHGNTPEICSGNVIINNKIENAGYMGIEDWGNVDGTVIRNNVISGTNKNPVNKDGIGISAVGVNTIVSGNTISDAQFYYIEVAGNHNCLIENNLIKDTKRAAAGIFVNFTDVKPVASNYNGSFIKNNTINNCYKGIVVEGDHEPNTEIINNIINNPAFEGININSACPSSFIINIKDNNIQFSTPNKKPRKAVELYSSLTHGAGNQNITLLNNQITYTATANGGLVPELGIELGIDNTVLNTNKINGNNIKAGNSLVTAITSNGAATRDITLINNLVTGAVNDMGYFTIKSQSGNNF